MASLSREQREAARLKAGKLFKKGVSQVQVARKFKVSTAAAHYWYADWQAKGVKGLKSKGPTGFASGLDKKDREAFKRAILEGPVKHGFETNLWTLPKLTQVLKKVSGFACSEAGPGILSEPWGLRRKSRRSKRRNRMHKRSSGGTPGRCPV